MMMLANRGVAQGLERAVVVGQRTGHLHDLSYLTIGLTGGCK